MRDKNQNLTVLGDKFSGKIHKAFKDSSLNKIYNNIEIERLITYNEILGEFIDLGYYNFYNEFEFRLYNGECPNIILESIITRDSEIKSVLGYLLNQIKYFINKDLMRYFN